MTLDMKISLFFFQILIRYVCRWLQAFECVSKQPFLPFQYRAFRYLLTLFASVVGADTH